MKQKKNLLPLGFRDVLSKESNLQFEYAKNLLKNFYSWGYSFIEPPIIEFESTLKEKNNSFLNKKTLSFLDPLTNKRLSLRSDITTQLARITSDRLFKLPKPLRLCYLGDVFRADKPKLSSDRQFKQSGIEIIGSKSLYADIEIIVLSLDSLKKINFKKISLDLNISIILEKIFDDLKIPFSKRDNLRKLVERKNIKEISNYNKNLYILLKKIIDSTGPLNKNIKKIQKIKFGKNAKKIIDKFLKICLLLLKKDYGNFNISVDLLDHRGFEYYTGLTFSIFCLDSNKEICRGGRYLTSNNDDAVGSTFFLNQFLQIKINEKKKKKKILIPYSDLFNEKAFELRRKGWITIQNINKDNDKKIAKLHNCKFILRNKKIIPLK